MTTKNWQIPTEYPRFTVKTALICLTHRMAKVYLATQDHIEEQSPLQTEATDFHYSDKEGLSFSRGSGVGTSTGTEEHNKEHYDHVFMNFFMEEIRQMINQQKIESVILFLPKEMKKLVTEKIPKDLLPFFKLHEGNLAHEHPLELLKRLQN